MLHDISRLADRLPFENGMKSGMKSLRREGSLDDSFFGENSIFGEYIYRLATLGADNTDDLQLKCRAALL
jgi:hypothetical protein